MVCHRNLGRANSRTNQKPTVMCFLEGLKIAIVLRDSSLDRVTQPVARTPKEIKELNEIACKIYSNLWVYRSYYTRKMTVCLTADSLWELAPRNYTTGKIKSYPLALIDREKYIVWEGAKPAISNF